MSGTTKAEATLEPAPLTKRQALLREIRQLALLAAIILTGRSVLADWYQVPTGSMKPTILEGDRVFVWKFAYQIRVPFTSIRLFQTSPPKRGDVVVIRNPDGGRVPFVKRVIGLPGDVVELKNEVLYLNGTAQQLDLKPWPRDPHSEEVLVGTETLGSRVHPIRILPDRPAARNFGPITVPQGEVFLMGDNRDESRDGRFFGTRPFSDLLGRAVGVLWSWNPDLLKGPRINRFIRPLATTPPKA
jgi:signal peptidase I